MKRYTITFLLIFSYIVAGAQTIKYSGEIALGGISSLNDYFGAGFDIQTVHGVNLGNGSFVGIGAGIIANNNGSASLIPVYVKATQEFDSKVKFSPYLALSVGTLIKSGNRMSPYFAPEMGITYKRISMFSRVMLSNTKHEYTIHIPENYMSFVGENRRLLSAGIRISFGTK